jgi:hypothetical protein
MKAILDSAEHHAFIRSVLRATAGDRTRRQPCM